MKKENKKIKNVVKVSGAQEAKTKISFEFNKKEYWNLMRVVYLADWVANSVCEGNMKEDAGIKKIRNKILLEAEEMGLENYIDYDSDADEVYGSRELEDHAETRKLIDRYNEETFWQELIYRLTERDLFKEYTKARVSKMDFIEKIEADHKYLEAWGDEFEKHGLKNLGVIKKQNK